MVKTTQLDMPHATYAIHLWSCTLSSKTGPQRRRSFLRAALASPSADAGNTYLNGLNGKDRSWVVGRRTVRLPVGVGKHRCSPPSWVVAGLGAQEGRGVS